MGRLTNLNPPAPIADADLPASIARDAEFIAADTAHVNATDPHLQYATQARGDARYVRKYGQYFRAVPSVRSANLNQGVISKIVADTITSNIGNQFSIANNRLIAIENEVWRITSAIEFEVSQTTRITLHLCKNAAPTPNLLNYVHNKLLMDVTANAFVGFNITPADVALNPGDYLELWAIIHSIGTGKIYGDANLNTCWWEGSRIG
jgi:hypothetical protein